MLIETAAFVLIFGFGAFLLALAILLIFATDWAKGFFLKFASSAFTHYFEMCLRIVVGIALVVYSSRMLFANVFLVFGWMLIGTSTVLAVLPWRLHEKFAKRSLPPVLKFPKLLAISSAALGCFLMFCLVRGEG